MPATANPVRRRARFTVPGFSAEQMTQIGEHGLIASIKARLARAEDVDDQPAPPLSMKYAERRDEQGRLTFGADRGYRAQKLRRTGVPLRNWRLTGHTLANMRVLVARTNYVRVGFSTSEANLRAFFNNRRARQFGVSPRDRQNIAAMITRLSAQVRNDARGQSRDSRGRFASAA